MLPHIRAIALATLIAAALSAQPGAPNRVPPKRSSHIQNGFGINSDLPRDPYLPWDRWWWTRMFDAGVSWIRIGQYENSSEPTSWDWVERKRGVTADLSPKQVAQLAKAVKEEFGDETEHV